MSAAMETPGPEFTVTARPGKAGQLVLELSGELDVAAAPLVVSAFNELTLNPGCDVAFDLSHVTFLDSAGMTPLVASCKRVKDADGRFSITGARGASLNALTFAGLLAFLGVE